MNIAYIVTDLGLGGTQAWVEYAATELAKAGHKITVITEHGPLDRLGRLKNAGIRVCKYKKPPRKEEYISLLQNNKVEIVHLNVWERTETLITLGRDVGIPLVLSYHHVPKNNLKQFIARVLLPWRFVMFLKRFSHINRCVEAHIGCCKNSWLGIRRESWPFMKNKTYYLSNSISIPGINSVKIMKGPPRFLQMGALNIRKNPMSTVRAFKSLHSKIRNATLTFVGDGPLRKELISYAIKNGISKNVKILKSTRNTARILSAVNILVLPSINEGLPYVLIEAAGRGIPLIATNIDGIPEVVKDNQTGLLIDVQDESALELAMLRLAIDVNYRIKLGLNGRALVKKEFNIQGFTNRLLRIYRKLVE